MTIRKQNNERAENPDRKSCKMQVFLKVSGAKMPTVEYRPADEDAHPADHVLLPGVFVDTDSGSDGETFAWEIAGRVADMCRSGWETIRKAGMRDALCDHLAYAYRLLRDYADDVENGRTLSDETAETLIKAAIARIEQACTCVDFALDKYGTED